MTPDRWRQISRVYHAALGRDDLERLAFLAEACAGDEALRLEVQSLLAQPESGFLDKPPVIVAAQTVGGPARSVFTGGRVGVYQVLSPLGSGGMGEVYLAEDTRLGRKVAIKFLSPELVGDERAQKRLIKEAQAAAMLDHPNICTVYEVGEEGGRHFIAMQYAEGETLAARIKSRPLQLREALDVAVQMADALAEAHARGIIHRDVKPQNVMLTPRGQVKVLDFGLAKVAGRQRVAASDAVTTGALTQNGAIVGTVLYMSPEQVCGEELDARSDIFSFGVVLYELVSGCQPFAAKSAAETIAAILTREPLPLRHHVASVPAALERIVGQCLEKEREQRAQSCVRFWILCGPCSGIAIPAQLAPPQRPLSGGLRLDAVARRSIRWRSCPLPTPATIRTWIP